MRNLKRHFCWMALIVFTACSIQDPEPESVTEADRSFLVDALDIGLFYVNAGQAAMANGDSSAVISTGDRIAAGQAPVNRALGILAQNRNMTVPTTLSSARQLVLDSLSARKGAPFDTLYPTLMSTRLNQDIAFFESDTPGLSDPEIRNWADMQLLLLREHLQRTTALKDTDK